MRLEHNRICTWNSEVEVGNTYLYTEGNLACKVKVIQTSNQKEDIWLKLRVVARPNTSPIAVGEEFEVVATKSQLDKHKWWYLHDSELVEF